MLSTPSSREKLLRALVAIPSVTFSPEEDLAAEFVRSRLSELDYFKKNPSHIEMLPVHSFGSSVTHTVAAFMEAARPTKKTVVLIAHYDVVDISSYGDLAPYAFDPDELERRLDKGDLDRRAAEDLRSGNFIFGRGTMDMKCGLALEMELLRDFDTGRDMFDVNIVVLAVPDEENTGAGMREGARYLARLAREEGLEYIAGIDTEPSEPGLPGAENQTIFLGSLGKLLPAFYCRGVEAHVGNYYYGLSAALLSSNIVTAAEAEPEFADPHNGTCQPSWICLKHTNLSEGYSVTVPNRSVAYFNCFVTTKKPSDVMDEMKKIAGIAAARTTDRLKRSHSALAGMGYAPGFDDSMRVCVISFGEIFGMAAKNSGGDGKALGEHIKKFLLDMQPSDMRDMGYSVVEELVRISGLEPPFVAYGFLPPYNPPITSMSGGEKNDAAVRTARRVAALANEKFDVKIDLVEFFAGISDMSYLGFSGDMGDVEAYRSNCPGWGVTYDVPFEAMMAIDMPVMNIGPCGYDAHRKTERVDRKYSLEILPELLVYAIRTLSEESGQGE